MTRGRYGASTRTIAAAERELEALDKAIARLKAEQGSPAPAESPQQKPSGGPILHLNVPLLLAAEPHLVVQVRSDSKTGKHLAGELTSRVCLVTRGAANDLIRGLIKAGQTPKVNE
jgi:hypothetical protein